MDQNLQAVLFWQHHQTTTPFIPHTGVAAAAAAEGPIVGDPSPPGPFGEPWEKKEEEEKEENSEEEEDDGKKY